MRKSIIDGSNGEKKLLSLERKKLVLKDEKRKTMQTRSLVYEEYCIRYKIKSNQTLKFDVTNKIKLNRITINKVEYMTY